jgi:hypothetical protein
MITEVSKSDQKLRGYTPVNEVGTGTSWLLADFFLAMKGLSLILRHFGFRSIQMPSKVSWHPLHQKGNKCFWQVPLVHFGILIWRTLSY